MKNLIIIFFLFSALYTSGQQMVLQSGIEKTVAGTDFGGSISYETKRLWALGSFYQAGLTRNNIEGKLEQKNRLYGMMLQAPVAKSERLAFLFNLRAGFINEKFLVLVPSLETRVHVSSRIGIAVGTGFRMGYPSLTAKMFFKIF